MLRMTGNAREDTCRAIAAAGLAVLLVLAATPLRAQAEDATGIAVVGETESSVDSGSSNETELSTLDASASNIASGTWGTCPWEISSNGTLTIHPGYGSSYSHDPSYAGSYYLVPWKDWRDSIKAIKVVAESGRKVVVPDTALGLFAHLPNLVSADLSGLDTSAARDIRYLFHDCPKLASANVASLDVSNVWYLSWMFACCESLSSLDVSSWDTSNVDDMTCMFLDCFSLTALDLSGWNTQFAKSAMDGMFSGTTLSEFRVGKSYVSNGEEGVPESRASDGRWYSASAKQWFTRAEVASRGVADTYTIDGPAPVDVKKATITVADQNYTGKALKPAPTVKHGGKTLKAGTDYTVSYKNNVNVGTATVTITGKGNYTGSKSANFQIIGPFFLDADPADTDNHGAEVDWMGTSGISTGWEVSGGREFRGRQNVTRCDFAAFLYRLGDLADDGERNDSNALTDDQVKATLAKVSDCSPDKTSHAAEVAWMIREGISTGWPDKGKSTVSFRPGASMARQDMAAFLYRFADLQDNKKQDRSLKKGAEQVTFKDVKSGDEANHATEVEWLASIGVTKGWSVSGGTYEFRGKKTVARQDMAAFMYRLNTYLRG